MHPLIKRCGRRVISLVPPACRRSQVYDGWESFLLQSREWPEDRIQAWQLKKLRGIVRYASERTEGYREIYRKAGVRPEDIQRLDDIRFLPLTNKKMFQGNLEAFSVKGARRKYITTGGSSGIPLGFYNFPDLRQTENAFVQHAWSEFGWRPQIRTAVLRGGFIGTPEKPWMYDPYRRELHLSTYFLSQQTLPIYIRKVRDYGIPILQAFPSSLNVLADLLRENHMHNAFQLNAIFLASENSYDWLLQKAAETFPGVRLFDCYGQSERVIFGAWCPDSREYHVNPFYGVTELVNGSHSVAEGSSGMLVGTSFHNLATPFIRYETMDRATRGTNYCAHCGRHWLMLASLDGRCHESIITSTGRYISMSMMNMHDRIFDGIAQFQFQQLEKGKLTFRYIPRTHLSVAEEHQVQQGLLTKLGSDVELTLEAVEQIKRTQAGKFRWLDQHLDVPYGDAVER
jgi:phenylacetate-CoA ligase